MTSIEVIYDSLMRRLPDINREACRVFGIEHLDTEILQVEKQKEPFGYSLSRHKLLLSAETAPERWVSLGARFLKYLPEVSLDDISTVYLAHESSHHALDAATNYEIGKEELELQNLSWKKNKYSTNLVVSSSISEGMVECATTNILDNMGMNNLLAAKKLFSKDSQRSSASVLSEFDIQRLLKEEIELPPSAISLNDEPLSSVINLACSRFREEFESGDLDKFRYIVSKWRPRQVTYKYARKVLVNTLKDAKQIHHEQTVLNILKSYDSYCQSCKR